jgi:hypothetical protein
MWFFAVPALEPGESEQELNRFCADIASSRSSGGRISWGLISA